MFVSKERVTRDGYLIAYEGEEMSEEEAARRGLLTEEKPVEKPKRKPRGKAVEED